MSAGDSLNPAQFRHEYHLNEGWAGTKIHVVNAYQGEEEVGHMAWTETREGHHAHGQIAGINVDSQYRRQGIASGMYAAGRAFADLHGIVSPRHSDERTYEGDAWAHAVSPKKSIPE